MSKKAKKAKNGKRAGKPAATGSKLLEASSVSDWDVDSDGRLIAVDDLAHRLAVEQADGRFRFVGGPGDGPGQFHYPRGVAIIDDRAYVVDSWNHRIQMFSLPECDYIGEFGGLGSAEGEFFCPDGILAVLCDNGDRWLSVADTNNRRIAFHSPDGAFLFAIDADNGGRPRKLRMSDGFIEVRYDDDVWERLD